jgi:hypothetical protein
MERASRGVLAGDRSFATWEAVPPGPRAVLSEPIAKVGPEGAIPVCPDHAPQMANAASKEKGSAINARKAVLPVAWRRSRRAAQATAVGASTRRPSICAVQPRRPTMGLAPGDRRVYFGLLP